MMHCLQRSEDNLLTVLRITCAASAVRMVPCARERVSSNGGRRGGKWGVKTYRPDIGGMGGDVWRSVGVEEACNLVNDEPSVCRW